MSEAASCLFCKIVRGEIGSPIYQGEGITAFRDINPQAPVHVLLVPDEHIASVDALRPEHDQLTGRLVRTAAEVARREGIAESGYRLLTNCGPHGGQVVMHLHLHLVGGREMGWPPG